MKDLDAEIRATRGRVLGEAVWRRMCIAAGLDPKDPARKPVKEQIVEAVAMASVTLDEAGFEGLEEWLEMEEGWC